MVGERTNAFVLKQQDIFTRLTLFAIVAADKIADVDTQQLHAMHSNLVRLYGPFASYSLCTRFGTGVLPVWEQILAATR